MVDYWAGIQLAPLLLQIFGVVFLLILETLPQGKHEAKEKKHYEFLQLVLGI